MARGTRVGRIFGPCSVGNCLILLHFSHETYGFEPGWGRQPLTTLKDCAVSKHGGGKPAVCVAVQWTRLALVATTYGAAPPDDMYHGRQRAVSSRSEKIKHLTLKRRKEENQSNAA